MYAALQTQQNCRVINKYFNEAFRRYSNSVWIVSVSGCKSCSVGMSHRHRHSSQMPWFESIYHKVRSIRVTSFCLSLCKKITSRCAVTWHTFIVRWLWGWRRSGDRGNRWRVQCNVNNLYLKVSFILFGTDICCS